MENDVSMGFSGPFSEPAWCEWCRGKGLAQCQSPIILHGWVVEAGHGKEPRLLATFRGSSVMDGVSCCLFFPVFGNFMILHVKNEWRRSTT